ncbi:hypothetical protein IW245_000072 [Longispora fulva]|uniref:Ricin B lectin domain-containing protein n=2 Tax=Longispora TaxID=203522 RepID=A0A8J7G567_9ACTN|nr:hypothetical protein [Longispora fulva]
MDVTNGNRNNSTPLQVYACNQTDSQRWTF